MLREARERKAISLDTASEATKIKKEFLNSIEKGSFEVLPSESYALGFVKNYARYLGVYTSQIVPLFRREYESKQKVHIVPEFRKNQHKFNRNFFSAKGLLIAIVVVVVSAYIFFQYSSLIFPPPLAIESPKNGQVLKSNTIQVKGKTDPYATVTVNGEEVYVNLQGKFQKSLYMFTGENKISVISKNRFGKEASKTVIVKVE